MGALLLGRWFILPNLIAYGARYGAAPHRAADTLAHLPAYFTFYAVNMCSDGFTLLGTPLDTAVVLAHARSLPE
jgi:hypothetical protein